MKADHSNEKSRADFQKEAEHNRARRIRELQSRRAHVRLRKAMQRTDFFPRSLAA